MRVPLNPGKPEISHKHSPSPTSKIPPSPGEPNQMGFQNQATQNLASQNSGALNSWFSPKPGERSSLSPNPSSWATLIWSAPLFVRQSPGPPKSWAPKISRLSRLVAPHLGALLSGHPHIWSPSHLAPLAGRQLRAQPGARHRRRVFFLVNQIYGQPKCGPPSCRGRLHLMATTDFAAPSVDRPEFRHFALTSHHGFGLHHVLVGHIF